MLTKYYWEEPPIATPLTGTDLFCVSRGSNPGDPFNSCTLSDVLTYIGNSTTDALPKWNANTNTPTLVDSTVGPDGIIYLVEVAGTTSLDGLNNWLVGDYAIFTGGVWTRFGSVEASRVQDLSNKTLYSTKLISNCTIVDNADITKEVQFDLNAMGAGNIFTFVFTGPVIGTMPSSGNFNFASTQLAETFTNKSISGLTNTLSNIPNSSLLNSSITINGTNVALGGSATIGAVTLFPLTVSTGLQYDSGTTFDGSVAKTISIDNTVVTLSGNQVLTNKTLTNPSITSVVNAGQVITFPAFTSSLATVGLAETLINKSMSGASNTFTAIGNSSLVNSSITINGVSVSLGGSTTVTASTTSPLTVSTGLQLNSGTTFDGGTPKTISIDGTVATLAGAQTLSNKNIVSDNTLLTLASDPTCNVNFDLTGLVNPNINFTVAFNAMADGSLANFVEGLYDVVGTTLVQSIANKSIGLSTLSTSSINNCDLVADNTYFRANFNPATRAQFDLSAMPGATVTNIKPSGTATATLPTGTYTVAGLDLTQTIQNKYIVPRVSVHLTGVLSLTTSFDVFLINKTIASATTVLAPGTAPALPAIFTIKDAKGDAGTNNITVFPTAGFTIDGAASFVMNSNYQSITLLWSGTNYFII
jgi:hypothetical protein